jgi:hypothetical protein
MKPTEPTDTCELALLSGIYGMMALLIAHRFFSSRISQRTKIAGEDQLLARITRHMRDHFQVSNSSLSVLPLLNNYYLEQFTNSQPRYLPSIDGQVAKIQQRCTHLLLSV